MALLAFPMWRKELAQTWWLETAPRHCPPTAFVRQQAQHASLGSLLAGGRLGLWSHLKAPLDKDPVWLPAELMAAEFTADLCPPREHVAETECLPERLLASDFREGLDPLQKGSPNELKSSRRTSPDELKGSRLEALPTSTFAPVRWWETSQRPGVHPGEGVMHACLTHGGHHRVCPNSLSLFSSLAPKLPVFGQREPAGQCAVLK